MQQSIVNVSAGHFVQDLGAEPEFFNEQQMCLSFQLPC